MNTTKTGISTGAPASSGGNKIEISGGGSGNNNNSSGMNINNMKEQIDFTNFLQHANHPGIVFFTILFKVLSVIRY